MTGPGPHALLSSERMDWRTPPEFLDLVRGVGPILIDPATSPDNPTGATCFASREGVPVTPGTQAIPGWIQRRVSTDGLRTEWAPIWRALCAITPGLAFWNPPYGAHLSGPIEPDHRIMRRPEKGADPVCVGVGRGWAQKYAQEVRAGLESIALVPVRTDSEWWHTMLDASTCALLWRSQHYGARIAFVDPDTGRAVQGSNLASTVFYAGENLHRFETVFGRHGRIIE